MKQAPFLPEKDKIKIFHDAAAAVAYVTEIYHANTRYLRESLNELFHDCTDSEPVSAYYPYVAITVDRKDLRHHERDKRQSHGYVTFAGRHITTLTRPDLYHRYYIEQLQLLLKHHKVPIEVGVSRMPIPVQFAFENGTYLEKQMAAEQIRCLQCSFDLPELTNTESDAGSKINMTAADGDYPLALFSAPHVDKSLSRILHYTGTDPKDFQQYVIFTNYEDYTRSFRETALEIMSGTEDPKQCAYRCQYTAFVEPCGTHYNANLGVRKAKETLLERKPQMPAYHLKRKDGRGITLVNIGIGPSNAKNISDHIAVLRPQTWIMMGHCAGLRPDMQIGDFILPHAYVRNDRVLDQQVPVYIPIPNLAEPQQALATAVRQVTHRNRKTVKEILRTGTVMTHVDRNWEDENFAAVQNEINISRAIALEMESATIATNGFRWCVPYGALLIVSDMPHFGHIKLPGMANEFYEKQVKVHLMAGIRTMELLRRDPNLHSRKLSPLFGRAFL